VNPNFLILLVWLDERTEPRSNDYEAEARSIRPRARIQLLRVGLSKTEATASTFFS